MVMALALLLLAACTGSGSDSGTPNEKSQRTDPSSTPTESQTAAAKTELAEALLLLSPDDGAREVYAQAGMREYEGIAKCMQEKGWIFYTPDGETLAAQVPTARPNFGSTGYSVAVDENSARNDEYARSLSPGDSARYTQDMFGEDEGITYYSIDNLEFLTSSSGCVASVRRDVYGSLDNWAEVFVYPQGYRSIASESVTTSPQFSERTGAWSECMGALGFAVDDPSSAEALVGNMYASDGPSAQTKAKELAIGTADYECAESSGLSELAFGLYTDAISSRAKSEIERLASGWKILLSAST